MNKKVYAKRILNDDDSFYWSLIKDDEGFNNYFIYKNKEFEGLNSDIIKFIYSDLLNYSDYDLTVYYKNNLACYIIENIRAFNGIKLNVKKALEIAKCLKLRNDTAREGHYIRDEDCICDILSILFNVTYSFKTIRGYSQSDWNILYYPCVDDCGEVVDYIESVYFNTGYEIMIHEEENTPTDADSISGSCFYCQYYDIDRIKRAIADDVGCDVGDVIYYDIRDIKTITTTKVFYTEAL